MMQLFLRTAIIFSFLFLAGSSVSAQHSKTCGSDHMTDLIKQQFPEQAHEWEDFHQRVIPAIIEHQPTNQRAAAQILQVPVVVHVIHSGEAIGTGSNLSVAQIQAQLDVLNEDFSAQNPNFNQTPSQWTSVTGNPDIQFCLANVDPSGNPSNGITRHNLTVTGTSANDSNVEDEIKPPTTWNSNLYYNIWTLPIPGTTANGGTVGYAYLPNNFTIGSDFDGTVVDWRWFGGPGFGQSGYKTLTHETGHYLGLPHTFNETDCNGDDNIGDTPNISAATASLIPSLSCSNNNFPTGPSSCGNEHMYVNYMDYVNSDYCYTSFTQGQISVMRGVLEGDMPFNYGSRLALINNSSTACASAGDNIGITSVIQPTAGTNCTPGPVTPQVTIGNFGTNAVTTFSVSYQVDNGTLVTENFVDNIASGSTTTVSLPMFTPPTAAYNFTVFTQNPNGVTDSQTDNDTASITSTLVTPAGLPLLEDFTATAVNPTAAGSYTYNPDADDFEWQHVPTSANGSTGGSILFDNYEGSQSNNPLGTIDAFITPVFDLSNSTNTMLTFDVAYARYENSGQYFNDSMRIMVSTDCGSNYNELVFNEGGATLETGTATGSAFTPSPNEWGSRTVNLNNYDGQGTVSLAFVNVSGWGNRLFLDNINLTATEVTCDLIANTATTDAYCFQDFSGTAQAFPQGGTAPYTYLWNNQMTDPIIIAMAGFYEVTITDANQCTATAIAEIFEPAPINFTVTKVDESVAGANDGSATTSVSGGTPGYTYLWSNQATTPSVSNLAPGNYSVTVTDQNGCDEIVSFVIQPGQTSCDLTVAIGTIDALCYDDPSGIAQALPEGGTAPYTYLWDNQLTNQNITYFAGPLNVTVTDANGCTATAFGEILEPSPISFGVNKTNETTAGANDGTATTVVSGGTPGYTFLWSNQATTPSVSNLAPGEYTVTVTDNNGCNKEVSFFIQPGQVSCDLIATIASIDAFCFQEPSGIAEVFTSGGTAPFTYQWDNQLTGQIINTFAGPLTVTVTDAAGCTTTAFGEIFEPTPINIQVSKTDETTAGANDGTATATVNGGTPGYFYTWSNNEVTPSISNLAPGTYSVTVTDNNGCVEVASVVIEPGQVSCDLAAFVLTTDVLCADEGNGFAEAFTQGGTAPYTYLWHNGLTDQVIFSEPGMVSVTVTDANGCTMIADGEILDAEPISLTVSKTDETIAGTNDGTATAVVVGGAGQGYAYNWSNNATTASVSNLAPGTYSVTVTDTNGCTKDASFAILPGAPDCSQLSLVLVPTPASCADLNNGSINAMATGGTGNYQYNWSNGMSSPNINNLFSGTYRVTITDQLGCSLSKTTIVNAPAALVATMSSTQNEVGSAPPSGTATVIPSGGVGNYIYQWSNGGTTSTITDLVAGTYSVTVYDGNQCDWMGSVEVENEEIDCSSLAIVIDHQDISCHGAADGFINALASGGSPEYIYQWNNGMNTAAITDLIPGTYQVTITDINGCSVIETTEITEAAPLVSNISSFSDPCNTVGGTLSVDPVGGVNSYVATWSNGVTGFTNEVFQSGNYQVTITDAAGCTVTDATNITVSDSVMEFIVTTESTSCANVEDGSATAMVNGGMAPYTYNWSSGGTQSTVTDLSAGTYLVEITDAMGCSRNQIFTVEEAAPIILSCSGTPASDGNNGFIQVSGSGGSAPYTYNWSTGDTGSFVQGVSNGNYEVTVTDQNGCVSECAINLTPTNTEMPANFAALKVFPNPADAQLFVQADLLESDVVKISLVNLIGQTIWTDTSNGTTINQTIEVADLAAGTYLLRLETTNGAAIRKVVIF